MSYGFTTHENDYINRDVPEAKDSTNIIAIIIYATESQVTSQVVSIYAQNRNVKRQQVVKVTDDCSHERNDQSFRFTKSRMMHVRVQTNTRKYSYIKKRERDNLYKICCLISWTVWLRLPVPSCVRYSPRIVMVVTFPGSRPKALEDVKLSKLIYIKKMFDCKEERDCKRLAEALPIPVEEAVPAVPQIS